MTATRPTRRTAGCSTGFIIGRTVGRAVKLAALASAALVALTGCAGLQPGSAAVVGSESISHQMVDDLANALCSANAASAEAQGQVAPEQSTRSAREGAVQILLDMTLSQQFGEERGVDPDPQQVSQAIAPNEQGVALLPEELQEGFRAVLQGYTEGQLMVAKIGRESLESDGQGQATERQVIAEGQRLRAEFVQGLDVEVDPRYGAYSNGAVAPGASSLSVPASDEARAGAQAEPAPAWVSALPASQKCS
ncbi:MAG TPA: hypothetical protein VFD59_07905 [Nocardioidaceae bacterium]|nr:hypothetical protein [Nocardioidaceae bacterium]